MRKSAKFAEPIFSEARYEAEINRYRTKRNFDTPIIDKLSKTQTFLKKDTSRTRMMQTSASRSPMTRGAAKAEDNSASRHKFKIDPFTMDKSPDRKLNMDEFAKKYEA